MPWVKNLCRLCGHVGDVCHNILGSDTSFILRQKIKKCLNLEITKEDFKPKEVCTLCCTKIDDFCNFLDLCYATNIKFESIYYTEPWHQNLNERILDDTLSHKQQSVIVNNIQTFEENDASFIVLQQYSFSSNSNMISYEVSPELNNCNTSVASLSEKSNTVTNCNDGVLSIEDVKKGIHVQNTNNTKLKSPKIYPCPHCEKSFMRRSNLNAHISNHTKVRPYQCEICSKTFAIKCHLTQHSKIHSNRFQCSVCNKNFDVPSKLSRHIRIHTNEKPFICKHPHCSKSFSDSNNLKHHFLTHQNDKQVSCDVCMKLFKSQKNLKTHMKMHVDARKFYCKFCQKNFKYKHNLKSHVSKHHVQPMVHIKNAVT